MYSYVNSFINVRITQCSNAPQLGGGGGEPCREPDLETGRDPPPVPLGASLGFSGGGGGGGGAAEADVPVSPPVALVRLGRRAGGAAPPAVAASCSTSAFFSCASLCFWRASAAHTSTAHHKQMNR